MLRPSRRAGSAPGNRAVPPLRAGRAAGPRQSEPGYLLAEGRHAGGQRLTARPRRVGPGNRREPAGRPGRVRQYCRGIGGGRVS